MPVTYRREVERPNGRVPAAGEGVCREDGPDALSFDVTAVEWDNDGTPALCFALSQRREDYPDELPEGLLQWCFARVP